MRGLSSFIEIHYNTEFTRTYRHHRLHSNNHSAQRNPPTDMALEKTAAEASSDTRALLARTLRAEYPFMNTEALEAFLDRTESHLKQTITEQ